MDAYEETIGATSTPHAPWYVIPADHKWFARLVVAEVVVRALDGLDLAFPKVSDGKRQEIRAARQMLES